MRGQNPVAERYNTAGSKQRAHAGPLAAVLHCVRGEQHGETAGPAAGDADVRPLPVGIPRACVASQSLNSLVSGTSPFVLVKKNPDLGDETAVRRVGSYRSFLVVSGRLRKSGAD